MKRFFILCFLIVLGSCAMAQGSSEKRQEIENIKLAFISSKLDLTTEEAQHFWPIYNAYRSDFGEIIRLKHDAKRNQVGNANQQLDKEINFDERILELKKKYRIEFSKVIPPAKVLLFFEAEKEFRDHLIKQLRERRQQNN
ncbi:MAG: hypothetical protein JWQ25_1526 [Daejeonella sp.]|nr:hypothetical protein [Daejeonella sp.]